MAKGQLVINVRELDQLLASGDKYSIGEGLCDIVREAAQASRMGGDYRNRYHRMGQIEQDRLTEMAAAGYGGDMVPVSPMAQPGAFTTQGEPQGRWPQAGPGGASPATPVPKFFTATPVAPGTNVIGAGATVVFTGSYNWNAYVKFVRIGIADADLGRVAIGPFTIAGLPLIDGAGQISAASFASQNQCCIPIGRCLTNQQLVSITVTELGGAAAVTVGNPTFECQPVESCGPVCY